MKALVIVDMEKDFMPGGALGVPGADELIPTINALIPRFPLVVSCQDMHPADHVSFAANHPGKNRGTTSKLEMSIKSYGLCIVCAIRLEQRLFPD